MASKIFKSCLIVLLLLTQSLAQDANPQAPPELVPATPVHDTPPPSQPTPEGSNPNIQQTTQSGDNPTQVPTSPPENQEEQPQPQENQQATPLGNPAEIHVEEETKRQIKKLLSEMDHQDLQQFQAQLAGDTRKYYDEIMAEQQKREQEQQLEYDEGLKDIEDQQTQSMKISNKQTDNFNNEWDKFGNRDISYNEYLFELDGSATEDFRVSVAVTQQVTFYGYTYENKDGVYSVPSEIQGEDPLYVYVYENNHRIVFQKDFYYKYFGSFQGQQNHTYLIRFVNPSKHKMIALNLAVLFEIGHSAEKLTAVDVADHSRRIRISHENTIAKLRNSASKNVLEFQNRQNLLGRFERYFIYSIVEVFIIAVMCILQVQFVRKLLSPTSVV